MDPRFKDWLQITDNPKFVKCRYCNRQIQAKKSQLVSHQESKIHKNAAVPFENFKNKTIEFKKVSQNQSVKIAEAKSSLYVAKHSSIRSVDHLIGNCKSVFNDSVTANEMRLSRTKCAAIIRNGWSPYFIGELQKDIGDSAFSLLIDESTDIGVIKFLGVVIKYFSKSSSTIITTFLKLAELTSCDAEAIVFTIKTTLKEFKLDIKKLSGLGTDNASVMTGRLNGVYAKLKFELPELILVPCICHSLQLAVSECCKTFLQSPLLNAIITVRAGLKRSNICCKDIEVPKALLDIIGTNAIYNTNTCQEGSEPDCSEEVCLSFDLLDDDLFN